MNVSVIGLGKLGFTMASVFAERGCNVTGFDNNSRLIKNLTKGLISFKENGLNKLYQKNKKKISLYYGINNSILKSEIFFIIVPTPSKKNFSYENKYIKQVLKDISPYIKNKKIVLTSTVSVGACRNELIPFLEKHSKLKEGIDFKFYYSPEFIALGTIIKDYLNPHIVLIGKNKKSDKDLENFYHKITKNKPYISSCSIESAEIAKIAINSFQTYKITFINLLSILSSNTNGAQIDQIRNSISKFFKKKIFNYPGLSYGGPCLPRDNRALTFEFKKKKIDTDLFRSIDKSNNLILKDLMKQINLKKNKFKKIIFIGLSFKENTNDISESPTVKIINYLGQKNIEIYDKLIDDYSHINFKYAPEKIKNLKKIYSLKSRMIVLMHKNFNIDVNKIHSSNFVINPWK